MSRLIKERTSRTHIPAQRAATGADPSNGAPAPGALLTADAATTPEAHGHRVLALAVAAMLVVTALIWGASSLGDGSTDPQPTGPATEFQYRPMAGGGVPIGP